MDFHAAMETFAEAWIAANMQNYATSNNNNNDQINMKNDSDSSALNETTNQPELILAPSVNVKTQKKNTSKKTDNANTTPLVIRSYPIRCVVEQESREKPLNITHTNVHISVNVLCDSIAVLPGSILFIDIVRSALVKLGYSVTEAIGAKGSIQIRNWKPVPLDLVSDSTKITLEEILGEIAQFVSLRIRLNRATNQNNSEIDFSKIEWTDQAVRCVVVNLLKTYNQISLSKLCPLPQSMISNIANSKYAARICPDKCKEFGEWYTEYKKEHKETYIGLTFRQQQQQINQNEMDSLMSNTPNTRLTFHPVYELPLMRQWYQTCPNPSSEEFKRYLEELNNAPVRQDRAKQVPVRRLKIWWRNEKQRVKRTEQRIMENGGEIPEPRKRKRRTTKIKSGHLLTTAANPLTSLNPKKSNGVGRPPINRNNYVSSPNQVNNIIVSNNIKNNNRPDSRDEDNNICYIGNNQNNNTNNNINRGLGGGGDGTHNHNQHNQQHNNSGGGVGINRRPVYVNSPSEAGFRVHYVSENPPPRAHHENLAGGGGLGGGSGGNSSSSRCNPPLFGLHQSQPMIGGMNPNVYHHIGDGLYSPPIFHPCSISSTTILPNN